MVPKPLPRLAQTKVAQLYKGESDTNLRKKSGIRPALVASRVGGSCCTVVGGILTNLKQAGDQ